MTIPFLHEKWMNPMIIICMKWRGSGAWVQFRPVAAANGALSSCTGGGGLRYRLKMGWRSNTQFYYKGAWYFFRLKYWLVMGWRSNILFQYKGASVFLQARVWTGNGVGVKYPVISVANTVSSVSIQGRWKWSGSGSGGVKYWLVMGLRSKTQSLLSTILT